MRRALYAGVVLLLLTGCSARREPEPVHNAGHEPREEQVAVTIQTEPVPIARQLEGQTGVIQLVVTDRGFEPDVITSAIGERVKIHLINKGTKEHTLTIPRWTVFSRNLAPGEENYIEFTVGEGGIWPFFSDAPGAPEPGLTGELKVE